MDVRTLKGVVGGERVRCTFTSGARELMCRIHIELLKTQNKEWGATLTGLNSGFPWIRTNNVVSLTEEDFKLRGIL